MQDGCKVFLHGIMHGIEGIMFHGHLDYFQKPPPGGRPYTKPGDHGTPDVHNHRFVSFYFIMCEGACEWKFTEITFCRGPRSHMTSHCTRGSETTLDDFGGVVERPWDTFLLGAHNFMVTALGSYVK